jgi:hypothetical protein
MDPKSLWLRVRPPLWARWSISLVIAVVAIGALVYFVSHHNGNSLAHISTAAEKQESRQAQIVVGQDQAPRTATIVSGATPQATLVAAVRQELRHRIAQGIIDGQLQSVACRRTGHKAGRLGFGCTARVGNVRYPFLAVANVSAHRILYCKRDPPPIPSESIPVSKRCRLS